LHIAARQGNKLCVKLISESHPKLAFQQDKDGLTPLMLAAKYGHSSVVKYIMENIDGESPHNVYDKQGNWALHWCATNKDSAAAIASLVTEDCPIEAVNKKNDEGLTPLYVLILHVFSSHVDLISRLVVVLL